MKHVQLFSLKFDLVPGWKVYTNNKTSEVEQMVRGKLLKQKELLFAVDYCGCSLPASQTNYGRVPVLNEANASICSRKALTREQ